MPQFAFSTSKQVENPLYSKLSLITISFCSIKPYNIKSKHKQSFLEYFLLLNPCIKKCRFGIQKEESSTDLKS